MNPCAIFAVRYSPRPHRFLRGSATAAVVAAESRRAGQAARRRRTRRKLFRLDAGLRIELVAAEPQIESPVAMAFDEDGRLWVVEMRDYPNGPAKGQPPQGRISILEDSDGDGLYETATVFADNLLFANGLLPWKGGVIVTAAPHIVYLKDTDGDGKADKREVLYEGFAAQNPQLRVSHPVLGLDSWVYVANGLRGGKVEARRRADAKPVDLSGMDFRFDPVHDRVEAISGMGQFGNTFDDWGHRFVCDNRHHLRHVVMEDRYLKRNPVPRRAGRRRGHLRARRRPAVVRRQGLSAQQELDDLVAARRPLHRGVRRPHLPRRPAARGSTAAPAFTCEPTGNLVHEEILTPHGATFRSKPAQAGVEFLATPDDWFRPVFLTHGPDGALYVVDMDRAVIEHPEFMPPELKKRPDLAPARTRAASGGSCRRTTRRRRRGRAWQGDDRGAGQDCWSTRSRGGARRRSGCCWRKRQGDDRAADEAAGDDEEPACEDSGGVDAGAAGEADETR